MTKQIVLLSGGIAAGKTFVSNFLAQLNANIIDTDVIARSLLTKGMPLYSSDAINKIKTEIGCHVFADDLLDRTKLRQEIFDNQKAKKKLENIMHPLIMAEVNAALMRNHGQYHLIVIPLLVQDSKYLRCADQVLVIEVSPEVQLERVMQRDNITQELALKIIQSQATNAERRLLANTIIINTNRSHTQNILKALDKKYSLASSLRVVK